MSGPFKNQLTDSPGVGRRRRKRRAERPLNNHVRRRLVVVAVALFSMLGGIGYRAYSMQVTHSERYRARADRQHLRSIEVPAPRGAIFDRKGVELAVTADADSVWANPRDVLDQAGTAATLTSIIGKSREYLANRLDNDNYFAWLARHITTEQSDAIRKLDIPGVHIVKEPRRFYPGRSLAGNVIGFADIDGRGRDGIELSMNDLLAGQRGQIRGIRDAGGRLMLPNAEADALAGSSLWLTFDRTVQFIVEQALSRAVTTHKASAGIAIVLEVGTGDVLAMASLPAMNPNQPGAAPAAARNRSITDAYEIGSIMKVFSISAALEAGVVSPSTEFDVYGGRMRLGRKIIHDSFKDKRLTVSGIIKRSSNIGAIQVARLLGREGLHDALVRYQFGHKTGIELLGERSGKIWPARRWGSTDLAVISYGYGMTATPLQTIAALAAIGSDGVYFPPRLIREVHSPTGVVTFRRNPQGHRMMKSETATAMMAMMASVLDKGRNGGTARSVDLKGFTAVGKTGTARKIDLATKTYGKLYLSSMAGLAPRDHPRIAIFVMIDEPSAGYYYGSTVAGPAFAEIVDKTLEVLGVAPDAEQIARNASSAGASAKPAPLFPDAEPSIVISEMASRPRQPGDITMPDFRGLTMVEALKLAASVNLAIELRGSGRAISQSIPAGPADPDDHCVVEFATTNAYLSPEQSAPEHSAAPENQINLPQ